MRWVLQRYSDDGKSTLGLLFKEIVVEGKRQLHFFCDTLEDEYRDEKVMHETRIPAGIYELKIRKEDTPLTLKHRKSYGDWFKFHIEITGIKNFTGVYIHAGNTEHDTSGCLLLAYGKSKLNGVQQLSATSRLAVKDWYNEVYDHLDAGLRAWIEIRDEQFLVGPKTLKELDPLI